MVRCSTVSRLDASPVTRICSALFFAVGSTIFAWLLLRGRMVPIWLARFGVLASVLAAPAPADPPPSTDLATTADIVARYPRTETNATARALEGLAAELGLDLAHVLNELVPDSREKSLAITHLEEVMMWSNAAIARQAPVV